MKKSTRMLYFTYLWDVTAKPNVNIFVSCHKLGELIIRAKFLLQSLQPF